MHGAFNINIRFNKTEAAISPCMLCFLKAFPFISLIKEDYFFKNSKPFPDGLAPRDIASKVALKTSRRDKIHELLSHYNTEKDTE